MKHSEVASAEVASRIHRANGAWHRFSKRVFLNKQLGMGVRGALFNALVVPHLLYATEAMASTTDVSGKLEVAYMSKVRQMVGARWWMHMSNERVLQRAALPSMTNLIRRQRLRWAGHVLRMPQSRTQRKLIWWKPAGAKRSAGGQRKRWIDTVVSDFEWVREQLGQTLPRWEVAALNRASYSAAVLKATTPE